MFGIGYISTKNRERIEKLQKRLERVQLQSERTEIQSEIYEIERGLKNYLECTLEEAQDLKSQILDKMRKISAIGRSVNGKQFYTMVQDVDQHIQRMAMDEKRKELERMNAAEDAGMKRPVRVERKHDRPDDQTGDDSVEAPTGRSRWTLTPRR